MNIENLTPAQQKAISAGGTNNAVIGGSLAKRGIMVPRGDSGEKAFNFNLSAAYVAMQEKNFADAMKKEEDETPTSEDFEIRAFNETQAQEAEKRIAELRSQWTDADDEQRAEISQELAEIYGETPTSVGDAELAFAEAVDADDVEAQKEILGNAAPLVLVKDLKTETRDPKETRYAHVARWTDENLEVKYGILHQRLGRRTLLRSDRMQTERHCQIVENEMIARGLRP